ncbi:MAG: hypothetical protein QXI11_01910 [Thermoproteota archaeon]
MKSPRKTPYFFFSSFLEAIYFEVLLPLYVLIGYMTFRRYLKDGLGERLKRIEGLLTELGCNYP